MKIACCGTQNMGKSTFIRDFLKEWPMYKTPEKTYRDIIKEKNLVINESGGEEAQKMILDVLADQAIENSKSENIILDRCTLDNLAYTAWLNMNGKVSDKFLDESRLIVQETLKLYDILFFFPISKFNDIKLEADGLRSSDPIYREEIDTIFKAFQQSYLNSDGRVFPIFECPAFIELYGSREERVKLSSLYVNPEGSAFKDEESLITDMYGNKPEKQIITT